VQVFFGDGTGTGTSDVEPMIYAAIGSMVALAGLWILRLVAGLLAKSSFCK
jgi:hypothetical protein